MTNFMFDLRLNCVFIWKNTIFGKRRTYYICSPCGFYDLSETFLAWMYFHRTCRGCESLSNDLLLCGSLQYIQCVRTLVQSLSVCISSRSFSIVKIHFLSSSWKSVIFLLPTSHRLYLKHCIALHLFTKVHQCDWDWLFHLVWLSFEQRRLEPLHFYQV